MEKVKLLLNGLVRDQSTEILTRSKIKAVASRLNFSQSKIELILLACNEIMSNQIKYAVGAGLIQIWEHNYPFHALDIFAYDMGPGIKSLNRAITDGYSTSNTLGHGLGSIIRSSDLCEVYSKPKKFDNKDNWYGTSVWCRFFPGPKPPKQSFLKTGQYIRALNDHVFNGDYINHYLDRTSLKWIHIDGLGHGKGAHEPGLIAGEINIEKLSPKGIIKTLNSNLYNLRKANGLAISLDNHGEIIYSGYGNVSLKLVENNNKLRSIHLPNRTIGEADIEVSEQKTSLKSGESVITSSDGIISRWNPDHYPGLFRKHPQHAAYLLGNLFSRGNDDSSLFIANYNKE